jgi:hypothetical protein
MSIMLVGSTQLGLVFRFLHIVETEVVEKFATFAETNLEVQLVAPAQ